MNESKVYAEGDLKATYYRGVNTSDWLNVTYACGEDGKVQGMLVIPFRIPDTSKEGTLYTQLSLDVKGITGDYKVDAWENLSIGKDASSTQAEISGMSVHYLTEEAYNGGNYTDGALQETASFGDSGFCYMVLDFTVKALEDNDGTHQVYATAIAQDREKIAIRVEDAPTGSIKETIHEGETTLYAAYSIPLTANEEKQVRMVFSLRPISGGNIDIDLLVSGDARTHITGEAWVYKYITTNGSVFHSAFSYTLNNDERSYTVSGFNGNSTEVVIPDTADDGLPVTGIAPGVFKDCDTLTAITISDSVTRIDDEVFSGCSKLATITIPDSVTSIGKKAFFGCSSLTAITIPSGVTSIGNFAFFGCSSLTAITIPDNVTNIGESAFSNCSSLTTITIPDDVTSIGESVFSGCSSLESITVEKGNTTYHSVDGCLIETASKTLIAGCRNCVIPTDGSVTVIGDSAFRGDTGLTTITIPASVTSIGDKAFYECYKLIEIYNLSSLTIEVGSDTNGYVGYYAKNVYTATTGESKMFADNDSYVFYDDGTVRYLMAYTGTDTVLTLPANCKGNDYEIYRYAFYNHNDLTAITIPNNITSIGDDAFIGCDNIQNATIPTEAISYIPKYNLKTVVINGGSNIGKEAFKNCESLTTITIPDGVTSIGDSAFYDCTGLTTITIPDSVTSIGYNAFYECYNIQNATIPTAAISYIYKGNLKTVVINGGSSIGDSAFRGCTSLTTITIPGSVKSIGDSAFSGCTGLTTITIPGSVMRIGAWAFSGCTGLTTVIFESTTGWWYTYDSTTTSGPSFSSTDLADPATAARYLTSFYSNRYWRRF